MDKATNWDNVPILLSVGDVRDCMGVSRYNAYAIANMLGLHLGRRLVVSKARLRTWLESHEGQVDLTINAPRHFQRGHRPTFG